jgi:hypothetical protein
VDHAESKYHGGTHDLENLQTLCKDCNGVNAKGTQRIDFSVHETPLFAAPATFPDLEWRVTGTLSEDLKTWVRYLRRAINLFYRCSAVADVQPRTKVAEFRHWEVRLHRGNNSDWLLPHLKDLAATLRHFRHAGGLSGGSEKIVIVGSDQTEKPMHTWESAILHLLLNMGGKASTAVIYKEIPHFKELDSHHRRESGQYGKRPAYQHQVRGHLSNLCESGDLVRTSRGIYELTEHGRHRALTE